MTCTLNTKTFGAIIIIIKSYLYLLFIYSLILVTAWRLPHQCKQNEWKLWQHHVVERIMGHDFTQCCVYITSMAKRQHHATSSSWMCKKKSFCRNCGHLKTVVPEGVSVCDATLSFSVLITVALLIRGGMKGAMIEASTRVMGMLAGKAACSMASVSMVSQKSSTCTSSETEYSGQVN